MNWNPVGQSQRRKHHVSGDENKDKGGWNEIRMRNVLKYAVISLFHDLEVSWIGKHPKSSKIRI